jgi:hypothetical protein
VRFLEGDGFKLVTIPETKSQAGLTRVMPFFLAWGRSSSRVRLGPGREAGLTGLRRFP